MYNPKPTEVVLMNVRLSYVHLMKPYSQDPATEPKYSFFHNLTNRKENLTIFQQNTAEYQNVLAQMSRDLSDGEAYLTEAITIAARSLHCHASGGVLRGSTV